MFARKRKYRKEKEQWNLKKAFALVFFAIAISLFSSFLYLQFFSNSSLYINPLLPNLAGSGDTVEKKLEEKKISFTKVTQEEGAVRVLLEDGAEVIFSSNKDIGVQVSSLQLTLSRITIEGKKLKSLDFRFENPVISFK
jgi:hypothetical protein